MRKSSRLIFIAMATGLISISVCVRVSAQRNPTMTSQSTDSVKENLYNEFTEYRKSLNPEERRLAYPAAKDYLRKFGGDDDVYARDVQKFVTDYERAAHDGDIFAAYSAKNYTKAFELGRPQLKADPNDFFVLATLTEAGYDNAQAGDLTLNDETIGYARRAIKLLEGGKLGKADPFKSMDIARGFLNFTLGWFVKEQLPVEAAAAFMKAAQSDSRYRSDPAVYHRMGVAILRGEFAQLSTEYNEKYGAKPASPEQKQMFERLSQLVERTIDAYARAVALSTRPEQQEARTRILAQLTSLYKNFHNNSDAGLNELIATVLTKPLPQ